MNEYDKIILYDGVCNLCNGFVNFVISRDPSAKLKFSAIQGEMGKSILENSKEIKRELYSIIYIENGILFDKSTAVLKILRHLEGIWPYLYGLIFIPESIRNVIYGIVAKNRYRWFGKKESCRFTQSGLEDRFL